MKKHKRNELGLLEGVKYKYNDDGSVDWRAMIAPEHLYPNKGWFESRNQPIPQSTDGLADHQLLIKLSGIKELAKLRGFLNVQYDIVKCDSDHVTIKCKIDWLGNFESDNRNIIFEDVANATTYNTSSFAQKFLETIAANRSFVRCVRNFLNIHIVGADEIDSSNGKSLPTKQDAASYGPLAVLMNHLQLETTEEDFKSFKEILRGFWKSKKYQNKEAADWADWSDIPTAEIKSLIKICKAE